MAELEVPIVWKLLILECVEETAFFIWASRRFPDLDLNGCDREGAMTFACSQVINSTIFAGKNNSLVTVHVQAAGDASRSSYHCCTTRCMDLDFLLIDSPLT
jgi:hypothetical protein